MPKPFPHPFQIGIDICFVPRILKLLNGVSSTQRKFADYLQYDKTSKFQGAINSSYTSRTSSSSSSSPSEICLDEIYESRIRLFTRLFNHFERKYYKMLEPNSQIWGRDVEIQKKDVNFVAGRYAAKEAVIKAVRYRRLNFHDIVILPADIDFPSLEKYDIGRKKSSRSKAPRAVVLAKRLEDNELMKNFSPGFLPCNDHESLKRRSAKAAENGVSLEEYGENLRRWDEGEEVELNISHDGSYAVAVCMARSLHYAGEIPHDLTMRRKVLSGFKFPSDNLLFEKNTILGQFKNSYSNKNISVRNDLSLEPSESVGNVSSKISPADENLLKKREEFFYDSFKRAPPEKSSIAENRMDSHVSYPFAFHEEPKFQLESNQAKEQQKLEDDHSSKHRFELLGVENAVKMDNREENRDYTTEDTKINRTLSFHEKMAAGETLQNLLPYYFRKFSHENDHTENKLRIPSQDTKIKPIS